MGDAAGQVSLHIYDVTTAPPISAVNSALRALGTGAGAYHAQLKGSIGEGPNQTNYSDQSSVRILANFQI